MINRPAKPRPGETCDEWLNRAMGEPSMQATYYNPDERMRAARVLYDQLGSTTDDRWQTVRLTLSLSLPPGVKIEEMQRAIAATLEINGVQILGEEVDPQ